MDTPIHLSNKLINLRRHIEKIGNNLKDINDFDQIVVAHVDKLLLQLSHTIQGAIKLTNASTKLESSC